MFSLKTLLRGLKWLRNWLIVLALFLMWTMAWYGLGVMRGYKPVWKGSPDSYLFSQSHRNNTTGFFWGGLLMKAYRPAYDQNGPTLDDWFGPTLFLTPALHHFFGWDILRPKVKIIGRVDRPVTYSDDDGDAHITIDLSPQFQKYSKHPQGLGRHYPGKIETEIDSFLRENFGVIDQIKPGEWVLICGRWVYDRAHGGQLEIHPAYWIEQCFFETYCLERWQALQC